jgi:hypothetical protein
MTNTLMMNTSATATPQRTTMTVSAFTCLAAVAPVPALGALAVWAATHSLFQYSVGALALILQAQVIGSILHHHPNL